jgi:hypothetical protein
VAEESGYDRVTIVADLGTYTSHFTFKERENERHEQYYLMRLTDEQRGEPAPTHDEEALFEPRWLTPAEAVAAMTYESEQEFARRAAKALAETEA